MKTTDLIDFLSANLDQSYRFTQRFCFVEIETNIPAANHLSITVFVTNNLPHSLIVSDSSWISENKYGEFSLISFPERNQLQKKWNIIPIMEETGALFHTIKCLEITELISAIDSMTQFIKEVGILIESRNDVV